MFALFRKLRTTKKEHFAALLLNIIYWMLFASIVVLPFFFFPQVRFPLEFSKTLLFNCIILIASSLFLIRALLLKKLTIVKTSLDWLLWVFVGFYLLSFIFSTEQYVGLVGIGGYYSASIISVVCFVLFFYLLINVLSTKRDSIRFLYGLLASSGIIALYTLFQLFEIYLLPWTNTHYTNFNLLANSSVSLSTFLAICALLSFGLFLYHKKQTGRFMLGIHFFVSCVVLVVLEKQLALYIVMIGLFIFLLYFAFKFRSAPLWWIMIPTVVIVCVALVIFLNIPLFSARAGQSITLDHSTSATIALESIYQSPLWGSGPQTFTYAFADYRPVSFNESPFWNLRFIKASNVWFGLVSSVGIVSMLALLGMACWHAFKMIRTSLLTKKIERTDLIGITLGIAWLGLLGGSFFQSFNFVLFLMWWFLLALGTRFFMGDKNGATVTYSYQNKKAAALLLVISLIVFIGTAFVIIYGTRIFMADRAYVQAQQDIAEQKDITTIQAALQRSIRLNPYESAYYISLAQGFATQAQIAVNVSDADTTAVQQHVQKVINTLRDAEAADPNNSALYEQKARLYDGLRNLISNVDELSVGAYTKAAVLDPHSSLVHVNLGRAQYLQALAILSTTDDPESRRIATSLLRNSVLSFDIASSLKQNFSIADYSSGLAYQALGNFSEAHAAYQKVLELNSNSAEARYQEALVYEQEGNIDEAIRQLEMLMQLQPDNSTVQLKIEALKAPQDEITSSEESE